MLVQHPPQLTQEQWEQSLTTEEKRAFEHWSGLGFRPIRQFQRTGKGSPFIGEVSNTVERAIVRAPGFGGTVYRGMRDLPEDLVASMKKGKAVRLDAMSSSSKQRDIAAIFVGNNAARNVMLELRTKSGADLVNVDIRFENFVKEQEVLLPKGSSYRVVGRSARTVVDRDGAKSRVTFLTLDEIPIGEVVSPIGLSLQ